MDAPKSAYQQVSGNLMRLSVGGFASAKLNFVAKFLRENGGSVHGYFDNSDSIDRKIQKVKTIFGLDELLCVNSGGSSVGFVGIIVNNNARHNYLRHNLTKRLGSLKVSENGTEMVCLNDGGLNTVPEVIIVVQYAFRNNISCLYSVMRSWYGSSDVTIATKCSDEAGYTTRYTGSFQPCKYEGYSALNPVGSAFAIAGSGNSISIQCTGSNTEGRFQTTWSVDLLNEVTIFKVNKLNNSEDYWDGAGVPYFLVAWSSMAGVLRGILQPGEYDPWSEITQEGGSHGIEAEGHYLGDARYTGGSAATKVAALSDMYNDGVAGGDGLPDGFYVITKTTGVQIQKTSGRAVIYKFFRPKQRSHSVNSFYIDVTVFFGEAPHNIGDPIRYLMKITAAWRVIGDGTNLPGAATVSIPNMIFSSQKEGPSELVEGLTSQFSGVTLTIPAMTSRDKPTQAESDMYYYDYEGSGWNGYVRANAASSGSSISGTVKYSTAVTLAAQ